MKNKRLYLSYFWCILFIAGLIFIDQFTKSICLSHLKGNDPIDVIPNVLQLSYVSNRGIAWGMLWGKVNFVVILTTIISAIIIYIVYKIGLRINFYTINKVEGHIIKIRNLKILQITLMVMFSGAIGNLIDRIRLGYVVDFVYFKLIDFPVFNVADIYVTLSMIAFVIFYLFKLEEEEIFILFKSKQKWLQDMKIKAFSKKQD